MRSTKLRGNSEPLRRKAAAKKTVLVTEQRLRAATTQPEKDLCDAILDRARQALAAVDRELAKEAGGG